MTDSKTEAAEMERLAEEKWLEEIQRLSEINLIPGNSYNLDVYAKIRIAKMYATLQSRNKVLEEDWKRMRGAIVVRAEQGHSDTCDVRLFAEQEYPCSCGHFGIMEALASLHSPIQ